MLGGAGVDIPSYRPLPKISGGTLGILRAPVHFRGVSSAYLFPQFIYPLRLLFLATLGFRQGRASRQCALVMSLFYFISSAALGRGRISYFHPQPAPTRLVKESLYILTRL